MPSIRDEIVRKLWRGQDPFLTSGSSDGAPDLQGGGSQHHYLSESIETRRPSIVVEVGVWKGGSVIHMASRLRDLAIDGVVIAVDTWLGSWEHWLDERWFRELGVLEPDRGIFATFLRNVRSENLDGYIVPLRLDSINAARVLRGFNIFPDVIHIDGGHDYAAVMADIREWWPLLRPGGMLIGDDYRAGNAWPGVKRAFDDYFRPLGLTPLENVSEKCRVYKLESDPHAASLWSRLMRTGESVSVWREDRRLEMVRLLEDARLSVEEQLEGYVRFDGPNWYGGLIQIHDQIARKLKVGDRGDIFGPDGEVRTGVVQGIVPGFGAHYSHPAQIDGFERFELLPATVNDFARFALPAPLNINMGKVTAPPLEVYRTSGVDLFLTPLGYQLFRADEGIYWPAASTRAYSREAIQGPRSVIEKCVVMVQDGFEGTNFSHFLFDWIPRLSHFLNAGIEDPKSCVFVMGGIPSEFHFHIIRAMCEIYSLDQDQFVFPQEPQIWRVNGRVCFFSDFKEANMHPANMAHMLSIAIIREVCSRIKIGAQETKRIYISRGDTPLRRVANETELIRQLRAFGFVEVQLASIPLLEQIKLVRGADVIVAPHGMGLTHIVFHERRPLIVELHNPAIGTDAYAFLSHALGFKYRAVLGTDLGGSDHHFNVVPRDVINVLREEGTSSKLPFTGDGASPIYRRFLGGVQSVVASEVFHISPLRPRSAVYRHIRDDVMVQPDNNSGWLEVAGLIEGAVYHCSCDLWLPSDFPAGNVTLSCSDLASTLVRPADPRRRDQWQTISIDGAATEELVNVVLRCDAAGGGVVYSSAWRFNPGAWKD